MSEVPAGRNDLRRATSEALFREGHEAGWVTEKELKAFDKARRLRNPLVHFRELLHKDLPESRAIIKEKDAYAVIEDDARHILEVVFRLVARNAVG